MSFRAVAFAPRVDPSPHYPAPENTMQVVNGKIVLGHRNCYACSYSEPGKQAGKKVCTVCEGTGKGKRGKPGACKGCSGFKVKADWDNPVTCTNCNGNYVNATPETLCDYLPEGVFAGLEFKVYRHNRQMSGNEALLGIGCVFSCTDYGTAWDATDDTAVIAKVRASTGVQATKIAQKDGTICTHVGIFLTPMGYSVRAVFEDVKRVEAVIASERPYGEYMAVGTAMAEAGQNGTLGAIYR